MEDMSVIQKDVALKDLSVQQSFKKKRKLSAKVSLFNEVCFFLVITSVKLICVDTLLRYFKKNQIEFHFYEDTGEPKLLWIILCVCVNICISHTVYVQCLYIYPTCISILICLFIFNFQISPLPCHSANPYSCKRLCGRLLDCQNHTCMKECHHVTKSNSNADGKKVG